jgi:hypothetical protein
MGSAFDKLLVLWTLCALTTLLCGVFLGVLYHLLGQQIFAAAALHTLTFFERIVTQVSFLVGERLTFGIDADEATFLAEPSPVRKWMEGKYAFKVKEDLNCNAIDAKFLSVDGRYVARNGPGPRFVVVARK